MFSVLSLNVGINAAASRNALLDWIDALVTGMFPGNSILVWAAPGNPPLRRMRGMFHNLNCNQVDDIESKLDSYTAWITQAAGMSAGRYLVVRKTTGSSYKLKINTKCVGIFTNVSEV